MIFVECWLGVRGGVQIIFANVMQIFSVTLYLLPLSPSLSLSLSLHLSLSLLHPSISSLFHLTLYFLGKPDMYKAKVRLSHIVASKLSVWQLPARFKSLNYPLNRKISLLALPHWETKILTKIISFLKSIFFMILFVNNFKERNFFLYPLWWDKCSWEHMQNLAFLSWILLSLVFLNSVEINKHKRDLPLICPLCLFKKKVWIFYTFPELVDRKGKKFAKN